MSRRVLFGFVLVNVIVSLAVAAIVVTWDRARRPQAEPLMGPTQNRDSHRDAAAQRRGGRGAASGVSIRPPLTALATHR